MNIQKIYLSIFCDLPRFPHNLSKQRCVALTKRQVELSVHNSSVETQSYLLSYYIIDRLLAASSGIIDQT